MRRLLRAPSHFPPDRARRLTVALNGAGKRSLASQRSLPVKLTTTKSGGSRAASPEQLYSGVGVAARGESLARLRAPGGGE